MSTSPSRGGPWIIAGAIVVAGLIVALVLVLLNRDGGTPSSTTSPTASPTGTSSPTTSPTGSPTPSPTPSPSPSPTERPAVKARIVARTFYTGWVANDRAQASSVGTPRAVRDAFNVPVRGRRQSVLRNCAQNSDFGAGAFSCAIANRPSGFQIATLVATPSNGDYVISTFILNAD